MSHFNKIKLDMPQKFTKGLVQITNLLEPPPLYNGLWEGGSEPPSP